MRAPATLTAIPLVAGCGLGLAVGESQPSGFPFLAAAAALAALIGAVGALACDEAPPDATACLVVGALVVGLALGVDGASRAYRSPLYLWFLSERPTAPVVLEGVLREDASASAAGVSMSATVEAIGPASRSPDSAFEATAARGGVRLSVIGTLAASAMGEWRAGRRIRVTATLREPTVYRNPGVPDDRRILARRGTALVGSVKSAAMVDVVARGSMPDEWAASVRGWVRSNLSAAVGRWSARSAGVATAILIGDRTGLAPDDEDRLQTAGTYHVIAISGGNIAILTIVLLFVARGCGLSTRAASAVAIVVLLAYGRVTGPAPSVDRAIAAAVLFLSGRLLELRGPSLNILAVAAALGVGWSPVSIADPGFLLSFGATLGILIGVPRLSPAFAARLGASGDRSLGHASVSPPRRRRRVRAVGARASALARHTLAGALTMVAATAAAEIALAPIGASLFGRITAAGLLLNLAAIPLMTLVQAASLLALAVAPVHAGVAAAIGYVVHLAATGLVDSARLVDVAPWLAREVAPPAWGVVGSYYVTLILALAPATVLGGVARRWRRACGTATALAGLVIVAGPHAATRDGPPAPAADQMRIVFLDVGQGDATLVMLPGGRTLLVDAGGLPVAPLQDPGEGPAYDIGERVVARAMRAFGVRSLDAFVITHGDPDHIGGARSIVRRFRPRAVWEGVPVPPFEPLKLLAGDAAAIGAEWRTVQAGDRLRLAGAEIGVLHPPSPEWERQRVRNDDSVVLEVRLGDVAVILPGDIGREGESHTRPRIDRAPVTILKVPHHGSATSSTQAFLDAVRPSAAIVSAGRANRFGHPAPVVVDRYHRMNVPMFSTADDGAVVVDTDGRSAVIWTWSGRLLRLE